VRVPVKVGRFEATFPLSEDLAWAGSLAVTLIGARLWIYYQSLPLAQKL